MCGDEYDTNEVGYDCLLDTDIMIVDDDLDLIAESEASYYEPNLDND